MGGDAAGSVRVIGWSKAEVAVTGNVGRRASLRLTGVMLASVPVLIAVALLQNGLRLSDQPAELAGILTGVLLIGAIGANRLVAERSRA